MIETGLMSWTRLIEVMSKNPAKIGGYTAHGLDLKKGSIANIAIVDPEKRWTVDRELLLSKSKNTPFHGFELTGDVVHTIFNGRLVMKNQNLIGAVHE